MKKIFAFAALSLLFAGCDFIRTVATRPTSAQLAEKRLLVESDMVRKQALADSIEAVRKAKADSIAAEAAILEARTIIEGQSVRIIPSSRLNLVDVSELGCPSYIMIGTFSKPENAEALVAKAEKAGYSVARVRYRNGNTGVGICVGDGLPGVVRDIEKVRNESFCPADVWILCND